MRNEQIIFKNPNRPAIIISTTGEKGEFCDMHFHKEIELLYVKTGKIIYNTDNGTSIIGGGEVAFFNSNVPHSTTMADNNTINILIQFRDPTTIKSDFKYIGRFLERNSTSEYVFRKEDNDTKELCRYMESMITEDQNRESAYDYYITANIYSITALLHRKNLLSDHNKTINMDLIEKIMPVIEYIDNNYMEQITLNDLSKLLNLNEQYFCRLFKKATGNTVTDYLNFVRVCIAEKLLKSGESVSEVSYKSGFSSLSYFNRIFKKYKQYSPSAYRKISKHKDRLIK